MHASPIRDVNSWSNPFDRHPNRRLYRTPVCDTPGEGRQTGVLIAFSVITRTLYFALSIFWRYPVFITYKMIFSACHGLRLALLCLFSTLVHFALCFSPFFLQGFCITHVVRLQCVIYDMIYVTQIQSLWEFSVTHCCWWLLLTQNLHNA